jgi:hypothetical protein
MYFSSDYKDKPFGFPTHDIDPEKKLKPEWALAWCEAIYAAYVSDQCAIKFTELDRLRTLRNYGNGEQSPEPYKDRISPKQPDPQNPGQFIRKGLMNIDWTPFSIAPKFKDIILGKYDDIELEPVASAIDPTSAQEKESRKWKLWVEAQFGNKEAAVKEALGIPHQPSELIPESREELEMLDDMGYFKLECETVIEKALLFTYEMSELPEIKRKIIEDFIDLKRACFQDYTDTMSGKAMIKYIDPLKLIIEYSRDTNHKNSRYVGHFEDYTILDLRLETGWSEEKIKEIAKKYEGVGTNPKGIQYEHNAQLGTYTYDNFTVTVMVAEWFSKDKEYQTTRTNKNGEKIKYKSDYGKVHNSEKKKTEVTETKTVYTSKWIVGTKEIFSNGLQHDIIRPSENEAVFSYHYKQLPGRSLTDRAIQNYDNLAIGWYKFQNALAKAAPPGLAIEFNSLQNITLGKDKINPLELLRLYSESGHLLYRAVTINSFSNNTLGKPVTNLTGGMGTALTEFIQIFDLNVRAIQELIGLNRASDAGNVNPNLPVKTAEMQLDATANALKPIYSGYVTLKERVSRNVTLRIQLLIQFSDKAYEGYYSVIGKPGLQIFKIAKDDVRATYGIKIQMKPTSQMKTDIRNAAMESMRAGKNGVEGVTGITLKDYFMINRVIESGNLRLAESLLSYREKKAREMQLQIQDANMEKNAEVGMKQQAQKAQDAKALEIFKTNEALRLEMGKAMIATYITNPAKDAAELTKLAAQLGIENLFNNMETQEGAQPTAENVPQVVNN